MTTDTICRRVVERIAEREGVDPVQLDPPLGEVLDPDALESLFDRPDADGRVVFGYRDHEVTVYSDQQVEINPETKIGQS